MGRYYFGSPTNRRNGVPPLKLGDDGGCFESAIKSVRQFGGVLEHPAGSFAFRHFGLDIPKRGAWINNFLDDSWVCEVDQGQYGHRARKPTWLFAVGIDPAILNWDKSQAVSPIENQWRGERLTTPEPFAQLLLALARSARRSK